MSSTIGTVLVPGAGLGAWIWRDVATRLDGPTLAVEFPGRAVPPKERHALGLEDYVAYVLRQIIDWNAGVERVVIACHSLGGVVGKVVSHRVRERIVGFVGISAAIPRGDGSYVSSLPMPKQVLMQVLLRVVGTKPPESAIRNGLAHDLPPALAQEVVDRFEPESRRAYLDPAPGAVPAVPRLYVKCRQDHEFDAALQDRMIANLQPTDVTTLDAGHLAMLSRPDDVADALRDFVAARAE
jgi:pimeloyl-ACP methyl ester carboxylesterase